MATNETSRDASEAAAIQTAVNNLIDAAPATLDTLNELAAAMADDPNFASSMATIHAAATTDRALIRTEALTEKGLKDATIAALQADVNLNEADGDTDRAAIRSEIAAAKLVDDAAMAAEVARASAAEAANEVHIDNAALLSGVAKDSVNLGTFTGSAIADNGTVKAGLQALETALEVVVNGSAVTASTITATGDTNFENTGVHTFKGNTFFHTGTNHIGGATMHAEMNAMYGMKVGPGGTPVMTIDSSGNLDTDGTLDIAGVATFSSTLGATGNISAPLFEGALQAASVQTHMSRVDAGLDSAPASGAERDAKLSYSAGVYTLKSATIDEIQAHAGAAIAAQEVLAAAARAVIQADVDANQAASDAAELALQNRATFLEGRVMKEYFVVAQNAETAFVLSDRAEHGSIMVFVNGLLQEVDYAYTDGQGNAATTVLDYTIAENGTVSTVTFNVPGLIAGDRVSVKFDKRLV